jgi:hypothetical protein
MTSAFYPSLAQINMRQRGERPIISADEGNDPALPLKLLVMAGGAGTIMGLIMLSSTVIRIVTVTVLIIICAVIIRKRRRSEI